MSLRSSFKGLAAAAAAAVVQAAQCRAAAAAHLTPRRRFRSLRARPSIISLGLAGRRSQMDGIHGLTPRLMPSQDPRPLESWLSAGLPELQMAAARAGGRQNASARFAIAAAAPLKAGAARAARMATARAAAFAALRIGAERAAGARMAARKEIILLALAAQLAAMVSAAWAELHQAMAALATPAAAAAGAMAAADLSRPAAQADRTAL